MPLYTFAHNFDKLMLAGNRISKKFDMNCSNISHQNLNVFLHYLAKCKCSYIIIFEYSGHKHLVSKSDFSYLN